MKLKKLLLGVLATTSLTGFAQDFNYGEALQKSLLFYEAQQSGPLPDWNRVSWRADSGVNDGSIQGQGSSETYTDLGIDLTGGWYDAGDHVKFNFPMAWSVTALAWGGIEYAEAYEAAGQMDILKRNLKFVTDYFIKCHTAPNELWGQVGNGSADHARWVAAELVEYVMERPSYKIDAENPGSDLAAETAAAMAAVSILFADDDPEYSATLIEHAKELYSFADNYRGEYSSSITDAAGFYRSFSGYNDEIVWGAAWLYRATGEEEYLVKAESEYANLSTEIGSDTKSYKFTSSWDDKAYSSYVLLAQLTGNETYKADAERFLDYWTVGVDGEMVSYSPGGQAHLIQWGSLRYAANTSFLAFVYADKVIPGTEKSTIYADFAKGQTDYALGDNPINRSFMVGFGNDPANSVHHRGAHGPWGDSLEGSPEASSHVLYGALAGGPLAADDQFEDDRGDFIANEVACDYNACFTGNLIRLYGEYGGEPLVNFPQVEAPTRAELRSYSKFNSNSDFGSTISIMFQNRTAWPARITDKITMRYFFDITEAVEAGYTIDDLDISFSYVQSDFSTLSINAWDEQNNIYYAEISLVGDEVAPVGQTPFRREVQIQVSANNIPYDTTNDWSAVGLTDEAAESANIPVYDNGVLVFGQEPPGGDTPRAIFTATPQSGFAPLEVSFDSSNSSDPNDDALTYLWDFGNGETSTEANPTITFTEIGTFEVSLMVSDGTNESYPYALEIDVQDGNFAPVAVITTSATSGIAPFEIDFSATGSSDENGDALTYSWDFGDGTISNLENVSHTFETVGEYQVVLTVSDGVKSDSDLVTITLNDGSPVLSYTYMVESTNAPFEVNFDASASSDPEGGSLTYAWDFGNGTSGTGVMPSVIYNEDGEYLVELLVTNSSGKQTSETFYVEVGSSNCKFNTPLSAALPSVNVTYNNIFLMGEGGPNVENFANFTINWSLENNGLYQFAFQMEQSAGGAYIGLTNLPHTFSAVAPDVSISGSGITGLDGEYYVEKYGDDFVMVSKTEDFTLYFSTSSDEPSCPETPTLSNPYLNLANYEISHFPNPASDVVNVFVKTIADLNQDTEKEVLILNLLGQKVASKIISLNDTYTELNVENLSSGIYIIQINVNGEHLKTNKLIVN